MRKAAGFKQNLKGASKASLENGATRYTKKGQYIILDRDKKMYLFSVKILLKTELAYLGY